MIYLIYEKGTESDFPLLRTLFNVFDSEGKLLSKVQLELPIHQFFSTHKHRIGKVIELVGEKERVLVLGKGRGKQLQRLPALLNIEKNEITDILYLTPPKSILANKPSVMTNKPTAESVEDIDLLL